MGSPHARVVSRQEQATRAHVPRPMAAKLSSWPRLQIQGTCSPTDLNGLALVIKDSPLCPAVHCWVCPALVPPQWQGHIFGNAHVAVAECVVVAKINKQQVALPSDNGL